MSNPNTRRDFLMQAGALAAAPLLTGLPFAAEAAGKNRVLVLVELAGGNDALNMVPPYADPSYARLRPGLAIKRDQVLQLDEHMGLHPAFAPLKSAWQAGDMGVVLGVGYPRPNRSHFRSIDIWETGSDSDRYLSTGWLARSMADHKRAPGQAADAIVLGGGARAVMGKGMRTVVMKDANQFIRQAGRMERVEKTSGNSALSHILTVQKEIEGTAKQLKRAERKGAEAAAAVRGGGRIGRQLKEAAKIIAGGAPVSVIKVSHGGFDTHSNQAGRHRNLLTQLSNSLAGFRSAMEKSGDWDRVMLMTYSEFGRRVGQNGSNGTDHGTAGAHVVMGGRIRGGLYGAQPSLTDLAGGDLKHRVDYRSLYRTGADWLQLPGAGDVLGQKAVPLLKA